MGVEAFVYGQEAFGLDGFDETIEHATVQISCLIIHS